MIVITKSHVATLLPIITQADDEKQEDDEAHRDKEDNERREKIISILFR